MKRTIEIDDTLDEIMDRLKDEFKERFIEYMNENHGEDHIEPDIPYFSDLDYDGQVHEMVDGAVPIHTQEITDLFYLYGREFEEAFENSGCGEKNDDNWPSGWKPAAIYCYLEQQLIEWYSSNEDDLLDEWWADNRPVVRAMRQSEQGEIPVYNDEWPDDYFVGEFLHVDEHGNPALYYQNNEGTSDEIDSVV